MTLCSQSTAGETIHQMREEVKDCLIVEEKMSKLITQISQSETRVEAMEHIIKYVPCIMHCENCIGLKMREFFSRSTVF